jgi:mRNA interferase RelE/StbE
MTARVNAALNVISQRPFFGANIKKLRGKYRTAYRYRVGNYRIVYSINTEQKRCIIRGILRHDEAYR